MKFFKELPKSIYQTLYLRVKTSKSLIKGKETVPVIVSITTIPERIDSVDLVVKSLLNQRFLIPQKIVLWLNDSMKKKVPTRLNKILGDFFEIKYTSLTSSHKKLIHTLKDYPNNIIITCDDDLIYGNDFVEKLYKEHLKSPNYIMGNKTKYISLDEKGEFLPYRRWKLGNPNGVEEEKCLLPVGAWGVLYPPNSLSNEVFDVDLFMKLAPKADDLWFKVMALRNKTISKETKEKPISPIPIIGSQKVSLQKENVKQNKNDVQWKNLSDYFDLIRMLYND